MSRWVAGTAAVAWLLGRVALGSSWGGFEKVPGVWRDAPSLWQWATLWVLLAALGLAVAIRLPRWHDRLFALVPLVAWIGWSLRGGTLGPLPLAIYGVPTLIAWCGALAVRDALRRA